MKIVRLACTCYFCCPPVLILPSSRDLALCCCSCLLQHFIHIFRTNIMKPTRKTINPNGIKPSPLPNKAISNLVSKLTPRLINTIPDRKSTGPATEVPIPLPYNVHSLLQISDNIKDALIIILIIHILYNFISRYNYRGWPLLGYYKEAVLFRSSTVLTIILWWAEWITLTYTLVVLFSALFSVVLFSVLSSCRYTCACYELMKFIAAHQVAKVATVHAVWIK